jgi:hypothetical protein
VGRPGAGAGVSCGNRHLLIADLKHPRRFYLIFTRHHWQSWLVRGSAVLGAFGAMVILAVSAAVHLALVAGEIALPHVTAHARLAVQEMTLGKYRRPFGISLIFLLAAVAAPWIGTPAAALALAGLLAYEHAYVQAGQCVPLA